MVIGGENRIDREEIVDVPESEVSLSVVSCEPKGFGVASLAALPYPLRKSSHVCEGQSSVAYTGTKQSTERTA